MDAFKAVGETLLRIEEMYQKYFPAAERKGFALLTDRAEQDKLEILGFSDEGALVGFAVAVPGEVTLIDYLAVDARFRKRGVGKTAVSLLRKRYRHSSGIVAEIEALGKGEDTEQNIIRARRKDFYIKNGFRDAKLPVLNMGVEMETMYLPVKTRSIPKDVAQLYLDVYHGCYGEDWTGKNIVILQNRRTNV